MPRHRISDGALWVCVAESMIRSAGMPVTFSARDLTASGELARNEARVQHAQRHARAPVVEHQPAHMQPVVHLVGGLGEEAAIDDDGEIRRGDIHGECAGAENPGGLTRIGRRQPHQQNVHRKEKPGAKPHHASEFQLGDHGGVHEMAG